MVANWIINATILVARTTMLLIYYYISILICYFNITYNFLWELNQWSSIKFQIHNCLFLVIHKKNKSATKYDKPSPQYVEANLYVWYFWTLKCFNKSLTVKISNVGDIRTSFWIDHCIKYWLKKRNTHISIKLIYLISM